MSDPTLPSQAQPPLPAKVPSSSIPLEEQYPPPPGPPPSKQLQSPAAGAGPAAAGSRADVSDEKEVIVNNNGIPTASDSRHPIGSQSTHPMPPLPLHQPASIEQSEPHEDPDRGANTSHQTPSQGSYPPPSTASYGQHAAHAGGLTDAGQATAQSTKQREHEASLPDGLRQDAPPPYTLEDDGAHVSPTPPRPNQGIMTHEQQAPPPLPPRPLYPSQVPSSGPPSRAMSSFPDDDPSNPVHYTRDPHRLIGYLVPFPKPVIRGVDPAKIPTRFLIYTPPPPPLQAPPEGEKESKVDKLQRKWQAEVREAKQSDAKLASWKGVKSRATKGISWAMGAVKSAELEFLTRVPAPPSDSARPRSRSPRPSGEAPTHDAHGNDSGEGTDHRTVGLEALDLVYPPSLAAGISGGEEAMRTEFINTMMRTRSKAQRDAVIATGLLPVSAAIDILATVIWPFGGLLEVDGVWAYASIRGAKTARSVTKRLASSTHQDTHLADHQHDSKDQLALNFLPSTRLEVLRRYLAARCVERDPRLFASAREGAMPPTEQTVLNAIGWEPSQSGGETRNWEDEQWETQEVKDDLKMVMTKAARGWDKWCRGFENNPEKSLKK